MNPIIAILLSSLVLGAASEVAAQGWVAQIDLQINHDNYAFESITMATVTFAGTTVTGSSATSDKSFTISGLDPLIGNIHVTVNGVAWTPYDPSNPVMETVVASYSGTHATPCLTHFIEQNGRSRAEQVYIWIRIHPRSEVSQFVQSCEELTLISNTCAPSFRWEVSDTITGEFKEIEGKEESTISITREELAALGFDPPHGRKYFRVTGAVNTTSQLQPVDIYLAGPDMRTSAVDPRCHDGDDGRITVDVGHSQTEINDFVVTLFDLQSGFPIAQDYIQNSNTLLFPQLRGGRFRIRAENNSEIEHYGSCWTDRDIELIDPSPVVIASFVSSNFNGFQISCANAQDGTIGVTATGGTGTFPTYMWTPSVSATAQATDLTAGVYRVQAQDSNGCLSDVSSYHLRAPERLVASALSTGGKNGFEISCHGAADGAIEADVRGGVPPIHYEWSNGGTSVEQKNLEPGTYLLHISDANNCTAETSITLRSPEPIHFSIAELRAVTCAGESTGILEIQSLSNAIGAVAALWSDGDDGVTVVDKPAGDYTATVTDQQGCSASQTYTLAAPTAVTASIAEVVNPSCSDTCDGKVVVRASGGTGILSYEWSTGTKEYGIQNLCEGEYRVTVQDENGCSIVLMQSLRFEGPTLELGDPVLLCKGQTYTIDPGPGWTTYAWMSSGGLSSSERQLTISDPGAYWLEVTDPKGCVWRDTFLLNKPEESLHANFLIPSNALTMDTLVIIDITWPIPETVQWIFSEDMILLDQSSEFLYGQFTSAGSYEITLDVASGDCRDQLTKSVVISDRKNSLENPGRISGEEFVTGFSLYPNPNSGVFEISVSFAEETSLRLTLLEHVTSTLVFQNKADGKDNYQIRIDAGHLDAGIYSLRLDHRQGSIYQRVIIR